VVALTIKTVVSFAIIIKFNTVINAKIGYEKRLSLCTSWN